MTYMLKEISNKKLSNNAILKLSEDRKTKHLFINSMPRKWPHQKGYLPIIL